MSKRDDFRNIFAFKKPDSMYHHNWIWGGWDDTLIWSKTRDVWVEQGMPASYTGKEFKHIFGYSDYKALNSYTKLGLEPPFKEEILREEGEYVIYRSSNGLVQKCPKSIYGNKETMPGIVSHPLEPTRDSWKEFKKRLDPDSPARKLSGNEKQKIVKLVAESDEPVSMHGALFMDLYGIGWVLRRYPI